MHAGLPDGDPPDFTAQRRHQDWSAAELAEHGPCCKARAQGLEGGDRCDSVNDPGKTLIFDPYKSVRALIPNSLRSERHVDGAKPPFLGRRQRVQPIRPALILVALTNQADRVRRYARPLRLHKIEAS